VLRDLVDPLRDPGTTGLVLQGNVEPDRLVAQTMPGFRERPHLVRRAEGIVDGTSDRGSPPERAERRRPVVRADRHGELALELLAGCAADRSHRLRARHPPDVDAADADARQDPVGVRHLVPVRGVGAATEHEQHDGDRRGDDRDDHAGPARARVSSSGHGEPLLGDAAG
jgi:hypothetical protein